MVKLKVLAALGVPEMTPLELFSVVPVGSAPEVTAKVYGDVPPLRIDRLRISDSWSAACKVRCNRHWGIMTRSEVWQRR